MKFHGVLKKATEETKSTSLAALNLLSQGACAAA